MREAAYLERIDHSLETRFLTPDIRFDILSCHVGPIRIIEATASPRRSERTHAQIARDRHDGISVQLIVAGRARGETGSRTIVSDPGTIMLLDFAQPFNVTDEEERTVINLAIPRALLLPHIVNPATLHGMVLDADRAALLRMFLTGLVPRLEVQPVAAATTLGAIVVHLLLLALGIDPAAAGQATDPRALLRDRTRVLIDGRIGSEDLTPDWLIARLKVSRSELYRAFEDMGGVARFIWRRRIEAARDALADPADLRRIGEIAFQMGFSSEAHFSRLFRQAFGITPSEARRRAREPRADAPLN